MKYLKIVDDNRVDKGIRFANYIIDLICYYVLFFGIFIILGIIDPEIYDWLDTLNGLEDRLITLVGYVVFMILIESMTQGRSIGKMITGTQVIMIDGSKPNFGNFIGRNLIRGIILIDQLSFFGETGLHDSWSNTRVIHKKRYENQLNINREINDIGES